MTHKVHPIGYRLGIIQDWRSRWFDKKQYTLYAQEDFLIRKYIKDNFKSAGIESIEIERSRGQLSIIIATSRPGILIGRGGSGTETIKRNIVKILIKVSRYAKVKGRQVYTQMPEVRIEVREIRETELYASLVALSVAEQLEKRISFRRVIKRTLERVMSHKDVKGAKVLVKGRLDGAEMGRTEFVKDGKLPLQTLRADVDYAHKEAITTYGVIGVKVWIYKGEKLD